MQIASLLAWDFVSTFLFLCWDLVCLEPLQILLIHTVTVSVRSYVPLSHCFQEAIFPWTHPSPLALVVYLFSSAYFPEPRGEAFDKDIPFRTEYLPVLHFLLMFNCEFLC